MSESRNTTPENLGLSWQRFNALEAEIATLQSDWKKSLAEIEELKSERSDATSNFDVLTQWMGSALGIAGALLLAMHIQWSAYGWISFLLSNFAWILFAYRKQLWSMLVMQLVFTGTSVLGIYQWILMA